MERVSFVWAAAVSFTKLTLSMTQKDSENQYPLNDTTIPTKEVAKWLQNVGWEKLSCMDESIFMTEKERIEWSSERQDVDNNWMDILSAISFLYEKSVEQSEPTNLIWDHMLSLSLAVWETVEEGNSIKQLAATPDAELDGSSQRHVKEAIRSLQRIRKAEMDPAANTKIGEDDEAEGEAKSEANGDDIFDDDILLGLQSKMKEMLQKIQDPNSGLGKLMNEIMGELKDEKIDLDPKIMMDMAMKGMMGGLGKGGEGGLGGLKDGPLGKIISIVEKKVKDKIDGGGIDELKDILDSTKDLFGKDPEEMKGTLMNVLKNMIQKMGLPKQAQGMIFSKMNSIIQSMTEQFMNSDGPAPDQEEMQQMLSQNMNSVMMDLMKQQGQNVSGRKAARMQQRKQSRPMRDPRLDRLEKLKERMRNKLSKKKDDDGLQ